MANGRVVVPAPAFTPSQYGLLSVARDMTAEFPSHWEAGIIYQPLCAAVSRTFDECLVVTGVGASPEPSVKAASFTSQRRAATPFTVFARKDCSTPTFWNDAPDEVTEALTEGEGYQVERVFWTGRAGQFNRISHPYLASDAELVVDLDTLQTAATVVTGSPVDIVEGLGLLEQALADCYQGQGVIHIPASLGPAMAAWGLIKLDGGRYVTANGNLVALGRGYTGSSPANAAVANVQWIYATGAVFYARSPLRDVSQVEGLSRSNNTLSLLAERTYVLGWDCCHLGIPIDITATVAGGSGVPGTGQDVDVLSLPSTQRTTTITRLTGGADLNIAAGTRSYTITVIGAASAASPTLDGVALPVGYTATFSAPGNDTLESAAILTVPGDDMIVLQVV